MYKSNTFYKLFTPVFEGEEGAVAPAASEGGEPTAEAVDPVPVAPVAQMVKNDVPQAVDPAKQQELLVAEKVKVDLAEKDKELAALKANFDALQARTQITTQSREVAEGELQSQQANVSDLQAQMTTMKEKHARDYAELETNYKTKLTDATQSEDKWKKSYIETLIDNDIRKASTDNNAASAMILGKSIRDLIHVEEGENGEVNIGMRLENTDGQLTPMSINDGVKYIKENVNRPGYIEYSSLFRLDGSGGINKSNAATPGGTIPDLAEAAAQGPEAYRKAREYHMNAAKNNK